MTWPNPEPGLVIRYAYLWHREAIGGKEEGAKDRPCAVILATTDEDGALRVYALPVTHSAPADAEAAVEIPSTVQARLGLDGERSWVVLSEGNVFTWPGPDLRLIPDRQQSTVAYGFLPPAFFRAVRQGFLAADRRRKAALVARTE